MESSRPRIANQELTGQWRYDHTIGDGMTERLALVLHESDVGFGRSRRWRQV